jgi:selenocysteine lyase/cysteine desulfurase
VFKPGQESSKSKVSSKDRPVVFMSVQEHHANILPWRNTVADVVFINDTNGLICLQNLKEKLDQYKNRPLKIGTFTAGSNVVGIIQPVDDISVLLHQYGAYAIFDYAGVGAYVPIDMNPSNPLAYKDAIVLSPHKMIGGPQTPGILSLRNSSFSKFTKNGYYPNNVGGGIVQFVGFESHLLINDLEQLEEAGTPAIIESIRAGLVFQLKNTIGSELIQKMEIEHFRFAKNRFEKYPNILILGDLENDRIPVFSFLIKHNERYFHYNFITTALNDLFGIQTRGGCMCAGPFASKLLNLDDRTMENYGKIITGKMWVNVKPMESFKPGFTRLSLNYFISDEEIKYIIDSVIWISENASKIISFYDFCLETGNWQVSSVNLETIALEQSASAEQALGQSECFTFADMIAKKREAKRVIGTFKDAYEFRWFVLPEDLQ